MDAEMLEETKKLLQDDYQVYQEGGLSLIDWSKTTMADAIKGPDNVVFRSCVSPEE